MNNFNLIAGGVITSSIVALAATRHKKPFIKRMGQVYLAAVVATSAAAAASHFYYSQKSYSASIPNMEKMGSTISQAVSVGPVPPHIEALNQECRTALGTLLERRLDTDPIANSYALDRYFTLETAGMAKAKIAKQLYFEGFAIPQHARDLIVSD